MWVDRPIGAPTRSATAGWSCCVPPGPNLQRAIIADVERKISRRGQNELSTLTGQVVLWRRAVELQAGRAQDQENNYLDRFIDGRLFLAALRQLIRTCEAIEKLTRNEEVTAALRRFDTQVPYFKEIRDFFEDWDDYLRGEGRLQAKYPQQRLGHAVKIAADGSYTIGVPALSVLEIGAASQAGQNLVDAVLPVAERVREAWADSDNSGDTL